MEISYVKLPFHIFNFNFIYEISMYECMKIWKFLWCMKMYECMKISISYMKISISYMKSAFHVWDRHFIYEILCEIFVREPWGVLWRILIFFSGIRRSKPEEMPVVNTSFFSSHVLARSIILQSTRFIYLPSSILR